MSEELETENDVAEESAPPRKKKKKKAFLRFINIFGIMDRNQIVHSMPFILFVTVIIIGYIANSYYAEKMVREIKKTKSELKDKNAEYIYTKSEVITHSRQSQVAKSVEPMEIKESTEPPKLILKEDKEKP
ncbi:MAG: hypothetical protein DWQ44_05535 [Bacteroidetes bacterium]|nr:MAG: hypothetical protein DWQ33_01120 [Bacteroidota bacterium]REK34790.1 MAG: hypothetical protein DWQ44_05535 [Bacteroidota bacterium]REK51331.1 MAG: hypothetical protein DWQ48_01615 [Bacteroidota bacterium]